MTIVPSVGPGDDFSNQTAALCAMVASAEDMAIPGVRAPAEAVLHAVRSGAASTDLASAFDDLDRALRRAGVAGGLVNLSRSVSKLPGVSARIQVALCPGATRCSRVEPAPDLRTLHCAVHSAAMLTEDLGTSGSRS